MPLKPTRVLLVEDHGVVRAGLEAVIGTMEGFSLVGSADSGLAALALVVALAPDLVVLDLHLPDISGLEVLRRLRTQGTQTPVFVLTSSDSDHIARQALNLGANGFCIKRSDPEELVSALQAVAEGRRYVPAQISIQLLNLTDSEALSSREVEVLRMASLGLTNRQIGAELNITERIVKFHFSCVFQKMNTTDRTAAVTMAIRRGLLDP